MQSQDERVLVQRDVRDGAVERRARPARYLSYNTKPTACVCLAACGVLHAATACRLQHAAAYRELPRLVRACSGSAVCWRAVHAPTCAHCAFTTDGRRAGAHRSALCTLSSVFVPAAKMHTKQPGSRRSRCMGPSSAVTVRDCVHCHCSACPTHVRTMPSQLAVMRAVRGIRMMSTIAAVCPESKHSRPAREK